VTGDAGVLLCREVLSASGVDRWLSERIDDARDPRPKRWYQGRPVGQRGPSVDAFTCNEVRLLVALFGYQIMHVLRTRLERATQTGWSLRRLLDACCVRPLGSPCPNAASSRSSAALRATGRWPPDSSPCCRTRAASAAPAPAPFRLRRPLRRTSASSTRPPNVQNPLARLVSTV